MKKHSCIAISALVVGVALSSASAFAQNGPGAINYGAGSGPQSGGQPFIAQQPAAGAKGRSVYDSAAPQEAGGPAGPGGANYGAGSGPQSGAQPFSPQTTGQAHPTGTNTRTAGSAGPGGSNYGAGSNPQTGQ
jgi:hypothetical protein